MGRLVLPTFHGFDALLFFRQLQYGAQMLAEDIIGVLDVSGRRYYCYKVAPAKVH
jgi:hypothetical protein